MPTKRSARKRVSNNGDKKAAAGNGRPASPLDKEERVRLPDGSTVAKHIALDRALSKLTKQMGAESVDFLEAADAVLRDRLFVRLHYQSAGDYFSQRFGYSYAALKKRLDVLTGLARIEQADGRKERVECRRALAELGIAKAAILAPVLGLDAQGVIPGTSGAKVDDWRAWVKRAKALSLEDLQREVNRVLNKGGGPKDSAGGEAKLSVDAAWFERTLKALSPDVAPEVQEVFEAARVAYDTDSMLYVLVLFVKGMAVDVRTDAEKKGWKPSPERTQQEIAAFMGDLARSEAQ